MEADWREDPVVVELRGEISACDLEVLAAVNRRLALVRRLHAYKRERGYPLVDRSREASLVAELQRANPGPLSADGLAALYASLLDLVKREAAAAGDESS